MKVIIAGTREGCSYSIINEAVARFQAEHGEIAEVFSGKCRGVDSKGEAWAAINNVPVRPFPYLKNLGGYGGPARNQQMVNAADGLIVIRYPSSSGSLDVLTKANEKGIPVVDVILSDSKTIHSMS